MVQPMVYFRGNNSGGCIKCNNTNNGTDTGSNCQKEELQPCIITWWIIHTNLPSDFIQRLYGKPRTTLYYIQKITCIAKHLDQLAAPFSFQQRNTFQKAAFKYLCFVNFYLFLVTFFVCVCHVLAEGKQHLILLWCITTCWAEV